MTKEEVSWLSWGVSGEAAREKEAEEPANPCPILRTPAHSSSLTPFFPFQSALKSTGPNLLPFPCSLLNAIRKNWVYQQEICSPCLLCNKAAWLETRKKCLNERLAWNTVYPLLGAPALNANHRCVNLTVINFGTYPPKEYAAFGFYLLPIKFLFRMLINQLVCFWRLPGKRMN